jgi:hypothetical protein
MLSEIVKASSAVEAIKKSRFKCGELVVVEGINVEPLLRLLSNNL